MPSAKNPEWVNVKNMILLRRTDNHLMVAILSKDIITMIFKCSNSVISKELQNILLAIESLNWMVFKEIWIVEICSLVFQDLNWSE